MEFINDIKKTLYKINFKQSEIFMENLYSYSKFSINNTTVRNFGVIHNEGLDEQPCDNITFYKVEDYITEKINQNKEIDNKILDFYLETQFFKPIDHTPQKGIKDPLLKLRYIFKNCFVDRNSVDNYYNLCPEAVKNNGELNCRFHFLDFRDKSSGEYSPLNDLLDSVYMGRDKTRFHKGKSLFNHNFSIETVIIYIIYIYIIGNLIERNGKIEFYSEDFYNKTYKIYRDYLSITTSYDAYMLRERVSQERRRVDNYEQWKEVINNSVVMENMIKTCELFDPYKITKN